MGNRLAVYKQPDILQAIEAWWETVDFTVDNIKGCYWDYLVVCMAHDELDVVVSLNDFARCLYKLGIRRLGDGEINKFVRAEHWRPSDEQVMRFSGVF